MTTDTSIKAYFHDIAHCTPLTREREVELSEKIKEGDLEARNELIEANLHFVIDYVKGFQGRGLDIAELIGAGNEGLIVAAQRFDGTKGCKFITYAVWWIRDAIQNALAADCRTVRRSGNVWDDLSAVSRAREDQFAALRRAPETKELADQCGFEQSRVINALGVSSDDVSMDAPVHAGEEKTYMDFHHVPPKDHEKSIDAERRTEDLHSRLDRLPARERSIIDQLYGLNGHGKATLNQIGTRLGVSRQRICQLRKHAIAKMRKMSP